MKFCCNVAHEYIVGTGTTALRILTGIGFCSTCTPAPCSGFAFFMHGTCNGQSWLQDQEALLFSHFFWFSNMTSTWQIGNLDSLITNASIYIKLDSENWPLTIFLLSTQAARISSARLNRLNCRIRRYSDRTRFFHSADMGFCLETL